MTNIYQRHGKRVFDIAASGAALVVLTPALAACALAVKLEDGGPVFYTHQRAGKSGIPFKVYKLRTMRVGTDKIDGGFHTAAMITGVGQFLRRTSLDELPQLLNVLRGEMSLVGPRPSLVDQVPLYSAVQRRRLSVRPGITGLAQVRYRNAAPWSVRILADLEYVDSISARKDLEIILRTFPAVCFGTGQRIAGQTADEVLDLGPQFAESGVDHD